MLVLPRKVGEQVVIGDTLRLKIVSIKRSSVLIEISLSPLSSTKVTVNHTVKKLPTQCDIAPSRKKKVTLGIEEPLVIDQSIRVDLVQIRFDIARLGIEAPREVALHRAEVLDAINRESARQPK